MKKKRELERFARFCFGRLNLAPICIRYQSAPALIDPSGEMCFGCYTYDERRDLRTKDIWLAYKLPKWAMMWNVAHEIWHYKQDMDGTIFTMSLEDCEKEAEKASGELVAVWLIRGGKVPKEEQNETE